MECFLHIGTEKTATTTIQSFLHLNRCKLLNKGFIYTKSTGNTNNRKLPVGAYNLNKHDDFIQEMGINSENELLNFQTKIIKELKEEIKKVSSGNPNLKIIFSSEHLHSRLTEVEELERLRDILYDLGIHKISVIVYVRNPAEIANSLFSTAIKAGNTYEFPLPPQNVYSQNLCNHKKTLEKFGSVFGESSLVPKIFHKDEFKNGSIIDDFLDVIGLSMDSSIYEIPQNSNPSLSLTGIHVLRRLNKIIPRFIDNQPNQLRNDIVTYIEKYFSDSKYVMPNYLYEQYNLEFCGSNEWVRKKYFPDKQSLFPDDVCPEESQLNIPEKELDNIANLIAKIWTDKQNKAR